MNWRIVGASVIGTSHLEAGTPCQDAHLARALPSGELILAVADGAGSAARSAEGAALAVRYAVEWLEQACRHGAPRDADGWHDGLKQCFEGARQAIVNLAAQDGSPVRQFATTLTCAILTAQQVIVAQIGDGFAVARDEQGGLVSLTRPQRGEYANEAYFLTMAQATDYMVTAVQPLCAQAIALSTDGLLRLALKLPDYTPHAPFFKPLFAFITDMSVESSAGAAASAGASADDEVEGEAAATQQLRDFLASGRVCARTDDDKTLVLAAPIARPEPDSSPHMTA